MMDLRVVAFDCDGVMFDTLDANRHYYNHILQRFGCPPMDAAQLGFVHSHTVQEALEHLFADEAVRQAAHDFRKTIDYRGFLKHLTIEPDLIELLDWMRGRFHTAIATNRTDTMKHLLREFGLSERFDLVVTSLDVQRPKPFPDPLFKILAHFRVEPHQALFVGDSEVDAGTARAAAVPFVAYRNPVLEARYHINQLKDLQAVLGTPHAR
ncbi:MAG TPA: HAD hydrolase-like protein [Desulfobacterales bacterium]|nr:HAD hydrolase-like protein [Desulfobacterales bacterium]